MNLLGVTPENNRIEIYDPEAEFPQSPTQTWPIFAEDKATGDIQISYYTIDGQAISYLHMGEGKMSHVNAKRRYYESRRLREPKGDMKYQNPAGQPTLPWFPPALVEKFKKKERITHLVLTEGVFKAWRGSLAGLDVVGLPSITCYKDPDGKLYSDIRRLIIECEVEQLIILWDGDCLNISKKDLQVGDELTSRPFTFFNSAKKIAELSAAIEYPKTRAPVSPWFAHVKSDAMPGRPKGLDDLLIEAAAVEKKGAVVREIQHIPSEQNAYFFHFQCIREGTGALYKYFRLDKVEAFYTYFAEAIGKREFKYKGSIYKWSEAKDKLILETPEWAKEIKWVGDEFFIEQVVPGAVRDRRVLTHWKEGNFKKLYDKDFITYLQHYRGFCNIPNHFNYQQVIETAGGHRFYNRYFPFPHVGEEGKWDTILNFIKHVFGNNEVAHALDTDKKYRSWELGLDYIQLLLTKPTQMLPVLCLYSPENNTGKSTLGKLLMHMFGDNAIPIGNQDLQSDFNEMYMDKLLAICDETLLERKKDAERIKAMSTADQVMVNPKGQKQYSIDFFCKFIFTSNNIRMVYVTKHDQRFWIIRVPKFTGPEDPKMLDKMKAEIPAFVHALQNRTLATECEGRMHFHASLIRTPVFEEVVRVNEPSDATNLRDNLREWFIQDPELKEIRMTLKEVKSEFFTERTSVAWVQEILKDYIGADLARGPHGEAIFERGYYTKYEPTFEDGVEVISAVRKPYRGRPYIFFREKFVDADEVSYATDDPTTPDQPQASAPTPATLSHPPVIQTAIDLDNAPEGQEDDIPF